METHAWIGVIELGFEVVGLLVLVIGVGYALITYCVSLLHKPAEVQAVRSLRTGIGQSILLGLELLVAADIIRSVAIDPTFASVGVLGLLVLVRTFLSWSLEVEIGGRWPWQQAEEQQQREDAEHPRDASGENWEAPSG